MRNLLYSSRGHTTKTMNEPAGSKRGAITGPVRLVIAARQDWRCSGCSVLLPSAFQVDHTIALADGGPDSAANATAMCASCHATKTQHEHIERHSKSVNTDLAYDVREDTYRQGVATCASCRQQRPSGAPHPVCWAIERGAAPTPITLSSALSRFAFIQPMNMSIFRN